MVVPHLRRRALAAISGAEAVETLADVTSLIIKRRDDNDRRGAVFVDRTNRQL